MPFQWPGKKATDPPPAPPGTPAPVAPPPPPALRIDAPDQALVERVGGLIHLPALAVAPLNPELPPKVLRVRVAGQSANAAWADFLTRAYQAAAKQVPAKLKQQVALEPRPGDWPAQQPLAVGTDARLVVHIEHQPTGPDGKPVSETPTLVERTVRLLAGAGLRPTATLRVTPPHLIKVYEAEDRGVGPRLTIRVTAEAAARPGAVDVTLTPLDLKTTAAAWGCPGLEQAVLDMLQGVRAALRPVEGGAILRTVPRFQLRPTDREILANLLRKRDAQPLWIPVQVAASGAEPAVLLFELHPQGSIREGLVVFDLGTSTSTAVRYDPMLVDESPFPREQLAQLRADLADLIRTPDKDLVAEAESYWLRLLREVCQACGLDGATDPARALLTRIAFTADSQSLADGFYEVVRQLEVQLWGLGGATTPAERTKLQRFQEKLADRLYQLYGRAFDKVPLGRWNIQLCRPDGEPADYVGSELELEDRRPLARGAIGRQSADHRRQWLAGEEPPPIGAIQQGRFLDCPKRFLPQIHEDEDLTQRGQLPPVTRVDGGTTSVEPITARQVLQAAWHSLIRTAAGPARPGVPAIDHVAATYPADLMPEPRQALDQALRELGMVNVYLDFDESVSPAVFHLEQLFGNMEEIGCEAFKVQCVKHGNLWTHHMLVLDIGAGTTDVSLIRLELREKLPDQSEFGGRVYEITPRLLGAAGRGLSGGHQLTLKLFRVLKQLLADWAQRAPGAAGEAPPAAPAPVLDGGPNDDALRKALERADGVLPTRFHDLISHLHQRPGEGPSPADLAGARQTLKRFNTLWQWAEDLKIHLSDLVERLPGGNRPATCRLDDVAAPSLQDRLEGLLAGTEYASRLPDLLKAEVPHFRIADFIDLAQASVERSIQLATKMAVSALENFRSRSNPAEPLALQSVVLSGRACALPQVREQLERELRHPTLGDGRARILFRRDYAKSATAIGACRAQRRVATAREHAGPPEALEGKCEMDLRIENLFFYLPAAYRLGTAGEELGTYVFERHTEFTQFGRTPLGLIRSSGAAAGGGDDLNWPQLFLRPQRETSVYRDDGDGRGVLWGRIALQDLVANKTVGERDLAQESARWRMRFEITHRRQLAALLLRPGERDEVEPIFDLGTSAADPQMVVDLDRPKVGPLLAEKTAAGGPLHVYTAAPGPGVQPYVAAEALRPIRCLGRPAEGKDGKSGAPTVVPGWLGPAQDLVLRREGVVTFYLVDPKIGKAVQTLSVSPRPRNPENPGQPLPRFPFFTRYRVALAADGRFALVIGLEPRYWETDRVEEWLTNPEGQILRKELTPLQHPDDWWAEPFCGRH